MEFISNLAGIVSAAIYIMILILAVKRAAGQLSTPALPHSDKPQQIDYLTIFLWLAISGVLITIVGVFFNVRFNGASGSFGEVVRDTFVRSDSMHYLGIAENGYAAEGDPRFHIVFFPAYPWMVRLLTYITGNYFISAMVLSNVFLYIGCVMMYRLGCIDHGRDTALRAVKLILVSPAAFFFHMPFTESMFLMLTVLALYSSRQGRYILAGVFGMMAALTRMTGIIVLGVIIIDAFFVAWREGAGWSWGTIKKFLWKAWPSLLVPIGTLIYIYVNYSVTGDPFKFSQYQREHWNNWFSPFPFQVKTITAYMLGNTDAHTMMLWPPQFIVMFGYLAIMLLGYKKLRASHNAYNLAYYFGTTSINWLLSSPRYLMCMFPAYYALAAITEEKHHSAICFTLSIVGLVAMTIAFAIGKAIY